MRNTTIVSHPSAVKIAKKHAESRLEESLVIRRCSGHVSGANVVAHRWLYKPRSSCANVRCATRRRPLPTVCWICVHLANCFNKPPSFRWSLANTTCLFVAPGTSAWSWKSRLKGFGAGAFWLKSWRTHENRMCGTHHRGNQLISELSYSGSCFTNNLLASSDDSVTSASHQTNRKDC